MSPGGAGDRHRGPGNARPGVDRAEERWDFFTSLSTTIVVDDMGRPDVSKPVDGPEFDRFVRLMERVLWGTD